MTFYNVISAILFFGACQAFLASLGTSNVWYAVALLVTILSEAVSTSELTERLNNPIEYKLELKLLDFMSFGILVWALLTLASTKNSFAVDVCKSLWGAGRPSVFWLLLSIYWLAMILWNRTAGQHDPASWKRWYIRFTWCRWAPFAMLALLSIHITSFAVAPGWQGILGAVVATCYLLLKLIGRRTSVDPEDEARFLCLPDWQRRILQDRLADLERNPDDEQPWDQVEEELWPRG